MSAYRPPSLAKRLFGPNTVAVLLICGAMIVSLWQVLLLDKKTAASEDHKVIRVAHWQLELGVRDALQGVMDRYNAMKLEQFKTGKIPVRVEVIQLPVSEKVYPQLINTHLLAGTAPDIISMGFSQKLGGTQKAEFMIPMDDIVLKPNPYNAPELLTDDLSPELRAVLPSMPWRETCIDGMIGCYQPELQTQFGIPISTVTSGRYSYNLDLLKAATGSDTLPTTNGELMALCDKLRAYGESIGKPIVPIAGSQYSKSFWMGFVNPYTGHLQHTLDRDRDGRVTALEGAAAMSVGMFNPKDPQIIAMLELTRATAKQFPNGFTAMDRESAMFMFTNQRAAILFTGAWDASTVRKLSKFRVAMGAVPIPAPGEPWGDPPYLPTTESNQTAGGYGVFKGSRCQAEAIDFLHFITSQRENERYNAEAEWIPVTIGSKISELMQPFAPRLSGTYHESGWWFGGGMSQVENVRNGKIDALMVGDTTPDEVIADIQKMWEDPIYGETQIWELAFKGGLGSARGQERALGLQAAVSALSPLRAKSAAEYRTILSTQISGWNGGQQRLLFRETAGTVGKPNPDDTP